MCVSAPRYGVQRCAGTVGPYAPLTTRVPSGRANANVMVKPASFPRNVVIRRVTLPKRDVVVKRRASHALLAARLHRNLAARHVVRASSLGQSAQSKDCSLLESRLLER